MSRPLPRYFVCRADAPAAGVLPAEALSPAHVVDCFFSGGRHLAEREWFVATDALGHLLALPDDDRSRRSETIQAELGYHEISGHRHKRLLEVSEFFLFQLQLLEQQTAAPGLNDPVYLYGTLFGPYPAHGDEFPAGVEGQLTVTRADVLDGLVRGAEYAFRYAGAGRDDGAPPRCFHLALPGDREEELRRGAGVVIAYPLLPPEVVLDDVANEIVVSQLLYDLLGALKEDLAREQINHPLRGTRLPVPSRLTLERQLQAEGYEIRGDAAARRAKAGGGFQGLLASVFGSLMSETLELPPQGDVDDFLHLARLTLDALPGWPSPRAEALRSRVRPAPPTVHSAAGQRPSPPRIKTPTAGSPPRPAPRTRPPAGSGEPPAWVRDFMQTHRPPGTSAPRLTSVTAATRQTPQPEWMEDFDRPATGPQSRGPQPSAPAGKPEWMSDFE